MMIFVKWDKIVFFTFWIKKSKRNEHFRKVKVINVVEKQYT